MCGISHYFDTFLVLNYLNVINNIIIDFDYY